MPPLLDPTDPIAAATHADPYLYYRALRAHAPLWRDDRLGMWIAARAAAVDEVLRHPALRVRPPGEPVPKALAGTTTGAIFGRLVRMNDGAGHCPLKPILASGLAAIRSDDVRAASLRIGQSLMSRYRPAANPDDLDAFTFALPVRVIAHLVGVPDTRLDDVGDWTHDFVEGLSPQADAAAIAKGERAAQQLHALFETLLHRGASHYLNTVARTMAPAGTPPIDAIIANGVGLLSQTYEAAAGLIGNTLLALARHPIVRQAIDASELRDAVAEVARYDAPVQNTRRFAAEDATVAGTTVAAGDAVLVILAAANRDPAANPAPDCFDPCRTARKSWTFGTRMHACPGENLAIDIATTAVDQLLAAGVDAGALVGHVTYYPSVNLRLPRFGTGAS